MLRGMYAAASALDAAQQAHQATAANLANASVPGYRQVGVRFETLDRALGRGDPPPADITGTRVAASYTDFRPGALQATGNPLDLALVEPDQFFVVAGPDGPLYTRDGAFRQTAQGQVVTQAGYPVQADGGPLAVPGAAAAVTVAADASVAADGVSVGRVRVVRFADVSRLKQVGPTYFSPPPDVRPQEAPVRLMAGYREGSNVNPAAAMVGMVVANRYYEAAQRALRAISDSVQLNTRPQG